MESVQLPSALGPYRVTGLLGRGGMGVVYRALDETLSREVAIKTLPAELTFDAELRCRFDAAARAQAKLHHPHIVAVHHLLEDGGAVYLVMEVFGSQSVAELLSERGGKGLPEEATLRLIAQVLSALDHAHSQGIIHRDVKPANVLVAADGTAKLTDFGIALLLGEERRTRTSQTVGTPVYMSPEQILRPQAVDHRTDIYSAAVLLFELLAGRPPFDAGSDYEIQRLHLEMPAEEVVAELSGVRPLVRAALARALRKDPAERFSSAAAFHRALAGEALADPQPEPAARPTPQPATRPRSAREAPPAPPRRTWWRKAIAAGLVAGVLLVAGPPAWRALGGWLQPAPPAVPEPDPIIPVPPAPLPEPTPPPIQTPTPVPPPPAPPPRPRKELTAPSLPDPDEVIRTQVLTRLRQELSTGTAAASDLLAAGALHEARQKVEALVNLAQRHRGELVDELAELSLLAGRITERQIELATEQNRRAAERRAWEGRLAAIEALIAQQKYPEAKSSAELLAAEAGVPADLAARARALGAEAEASLPLLFEGTKVETDAAILNPRRKKKTVLEDEDDDDDPRKRGLP